MGYGKYTLKKLFFDPQKPLFYPKKPSKTPQKAITKSKTVEKTPPSINETRILKGISPAYAYQRSYDTAHPCARTLIFHWGQMNKWGASARTSPRGTMIGSGMHTFISRFLYVNLYPTSYEVNLHPWLDRLDRLQYAKSH